MKNKSLIAKSKTTKCWMCAGKGVVTIPQTHPLVREICPTCEGTGKWVETSYIVIDNKNKIAIDSDMGG
jgi:DnaJ-class molecular chaperone